MASAAHPHLASALFNVSSQAPPQPFVSAGAFDVDAAALEGGYRYSEITSITGSTGTGKTLLGYHAIASHLLREDEGRGEAQGRRTAGGIVALIDTTGGFSVVRLRDVLVFRLRARWQRGNGQGYRRAGESREQFMEAATEMLGRIRVMRVFDLVGVIEALEEIGGKMGRENVVRQGKRQREIEDSEEEGDNNGQQLGTQALERDGTAARGQNDDGEDLMDMIIIDTITNVANSVISRSPIQGQALLATCMRSLKHLTVRHGMCTVIINSAVGLNPQHSRSPDDNVSIFASSLGKLALGTAFTSSIDTSVFLSLIPKTQDDAVTAYGDNVQGCTWRKVIVLEVLKDKHGTREGRWAAFEIVDSVKLVPCFT